MVHRSQSEYSGTHNSWRDSRGTRRPRGATWAGSRGATYAGSDADAADGHARPAHADASDGGGLMAKPRRLADETEEQYTARCRAYWRDYRRRRRAAGIDGMGNYWREFAPRVRMVKGPWTEDAHGVLSREVRGV